MKECMYAIMIAMILLMGCVNTENNNAVNTSSENISAVDKIVDNTTILSEINATSLKNMSDCNCSYTKKTMSEEKNVVNKKVSNDSKILTIKQIDEDFVNITESNEIIKNINNSTIKSKVKIIGMNTTEENIENMIEQNK